MQSFSFGLTFKYKYCWETGIEATSLPDVSVFLLFNTNSTQFWCVRTCIYIHMYITSMNTELQLYSYPNIFQIYFFAQYFICQILYSSSSSFTHFSSFSIFHFSCFYFSLGSPQPYVACQLCAEFRFSCLLSFFVFFHVFFFVFLSDFPY